MAMDKIFIQIGFFIHTDSARKKISFNSIKICAIFTIYLSLSLQKCFYGLSLYKYWSYLIGHLMYRMKFKKKILV